MTIAYSVNGGSEIHGVFSTWARLTTSDQLDGTLEFSPHALNVWTVPQMTGTIFDTLRAAQGEALTSLETNDITNRNTGATYTMAILESLTAGGHEGLVLTGVEVVFRVDTS